MHVHGQQQLLKFKVVKSRLVLGQFFKGIIMGPIKTFIHITYVSETFPSRKNYAIGVMGVNDCYAHFLFCFCAVVKKNPVSAPE